jgi:putative acetyltransferase
MELFSSLAYFRRVTPDFLPVALFIWVFFWRSSGTKLEYMQIEISTEKSLSEELATLLQAHWLFCTSTTPIEHVYALDASRLFTPDITVFGARIQDELVGVGALRIPDIEHAELKSMHTLSQSRGLGISKAVVSHIEEFAKGQGIKRISLETGTSEAFKPARELYKSLVDPNLQCSWLSENSSTLSKPLPSKAA